MTQEICTNCGCTFNTPYCPRCGQRSGVGRLSWRSLWEGVMSSVVGDGFDGEKDGVVRYGAVGTLWQIVRHPVTTVTEYLTGCRRKYFNPITLLLLLSTAGALLYSWFGLELVNTPQTLDDELAASTASAMSDFANRHPALFILVSTPAMALGMKWVFRPRKLSLIEFFYIEIFSAIISMLLLFALMWIPNQSESVLFAVLKSIPAFCIEFVILKRLFGHSILRTGASMAASYAIGLTLAFAATIVFTAIGMICYTIINQA